jgi:hypothetical protein
MKAAQEQMRAEIKTVLESQARSYCPAEPDFRCSSRRLPETELQFSLERWIVCTPLRVNIFVTLATQ